MSTSIPRLFFALPLLCLLSCSSQRHVSPPPAQASVSTYTAKITNGQVFLSLNAKPDQLIGPFVKRSDDTYTCETQGEGVHSLTRSPTGDWFYSWSYIQMRAEPVDGRVLMR
jgi:hypothetical protein